MEQMTTHQQNIPATNEEIAKVASALWNDPSLQKAFLRAGLHGDLTASEESEVAALVESFLTGELAGRDFLHLKLAPCLARRRAAGLIKTFSDEESKKFLECRKVIRIGNGIKSTRAQIGDIIALAKAMLADPMVWKTIREVSFEGRFTDIQGGIVDIFVQKFIDKYGLTSIGHPGLSAALTLCRFLEDGRIQDLDSDQAAALVRQYQY
jgi:hypothetical protein